VDRMPLPAARWLAAACCALVVGHTLSEGSILALQQSGACRLRSHELLLPELRAAAACPPESASCCCSAHLLLQLALALAAQLMGLDLGCKQHAGRSI
jgi:hypothetical protein